MAAKQKGNELQAAVRQLRPLIIGLLVTALLCGIIYYGFSAYLRRIHRALLWNLFLAALPLAFSLLVVRRQSAGKGGWLTLLLGLVWLGFFPNCPYVFTDLIHLDYYVYCIAGQGFSPNVTAWLGLLHLVLVAMTGVLFGLVSLYFMHLVAKRHWGSIGGWLLCAAVSVLSGVGIYIGRFMRLNTWDLVSRPLLLAQRVIASISLQTLALYAIFALLTLLPYLLFHACVAAHE